jgi:uncharacterized repeat protein (TIGR04076 family)
VHKIGQKYIYPNEIGNICPWLLDSINSMVRVLQFNGKLPWKYKGTKYEKIMDEELATEYVRCPDPTSSGIVVKISCKKIDNINVGWC